MKKTAMTCTPRKLVARFLAITTLATAGGAQAFCVYNNSKDVISVEGAGPKHSIYFPRFSKTIQPGQSACCAHDNRDCNRAGKADAIVLLAVTYGAGSKYRCTADAKSNHVQLNANGYITVDNAALWGPQVARVASWHPNHSLRENTYCPGASIP